MSISSSKHHYIQSMMDVKVGDVLTVRSKAWYDENQFDGDVKPPRCYCVFSRYMASFCGCKLKVRQVDRYAGHEHYFPSIVMEEVSGFVWEPWMFEEYDDLMEPKPHYYS